MHATTTQRRETQNDAPPLALAISDAAIRAGVGRSTIYAAINSGALLARKARRRTIVLDTDLQAWLGSLPSYVVGGRS